MRVLALLLLVPVLIGASAGPGVLGYHPIRTDASGRLLPWYGTEPGEAYDHVVRRVWDFWRRLPACPNGVPYYLQHQVWKPEHDPRGLGGDQISMALSSWNLLYGYLGDESVKENMIQIADYWLAHGLSPAECRWANLPFPYNTAVHSGQYDGDMVAGKGFLQPDKAASFGAELIVLYRMTGNHKYRDAAVRIADTLSARVEEGDADHSPWPFRVHAFNGRTHQETVGGKAYRASYTTNYTGALRLLDDLIQMGEANKDAYQRSRQVIRRWLEAYPLKTNKWGPFFEDIPTRTWSDTEINADTMAGYILEHADAFPRWREQAREILDWTLSVFANREFRTLGVLPINEQTAYPVPGNSHTARHASVELLYVEKAGDRSLKEGAIRRLHWATYMVDEDGKNRYPQNDIWLTDGYGDYVRHYLRAMAACPELAPNDQNHLLRTSSVIQTIRYEPARITYRKFDDQSEERFKLGAWSQVHVTGGEGVWDQKSKVLTVRSSRKEIVIEKVP